MRFSKVTFLILVIMALVISSCSSSEGQSDEPTRSSEDVLRTAEAIAEKTRQAVTPTHTNTPITPTATSPPPTETPVLTATPTVPIVSPVYNANVRSGPDEAYPIIDFFLEGQEAEVIGRYDHPQMGTWWFIKRIGQGLNGWVWNGAVILSGNPAEIPYFEPPPTPTETSLPTSLPQPTDTPAETATP
ncbi:MAG: SH3 domain-containing protein [Anaerolineales bacterium]|nr:SH3 domain-containing protein [Anaerolineales bacterium]